MCQIQRFDDKVRWLDMAFHKEQAPAYRVPRYVQRRCGLAAGGRSAGPEACGNGPLSVGTAQEAGACSMHGELSSALREPCRWDSGPVREARCSGVRSTLDGPPKAQHFVAGLWALAQL